MDAKCAHINVKWITETDKDGLTHGWWECMQCGLIFTPVTWIKKDNPPYNPGWYATASYGQKQSTPRYFDDTDKSWWIYSNHHDNNTVVPNDSFDVWMPLPEPPEEE